MVMFGLVVDARREFRIDFAVVRFREETKIADWMTWSGVGLGGTTLASPKEDSHVWGCCVALQAKWISVWVCLVVIGAGIDGKSCVCGEYRCSLLVFEERVKKRMRETRDNKRTLAIMITKHLDFELKNGGLWPKLLSGFVEPAGEDGSAMMVVWWFKAFALEGCCYIKKIWAHVKAPHPVW